MKLSGYLATNLCRFRVSNHLLPIELGRHRNIERELRFLQREKMNIRLCVFCESLKIERETYP